MIAGRGAMQSDYMHWAKQQQPVRYALSSSEVPHFRLDRLGLTIDDLDLDGASHPRYAPLREAIAAHAGVATEQVVCADGTSMANFLALAALIAPGDEVLFELPGYEPLLAAARFLGADVKRFVRAPDLGFGVDLDALRTTASPRTRLIVLANLHNPSGAFVDEDTLRQIGDIAERCDAHVLVDEVYLDAVVLRPQSAALLGPRFVTTSSLTKVYGLSGLRCGWILADPALVERIWRLNDLFVVNRAHQAERLACFAFQHLGEVFAGTTTRLATNRALFDAFVESRADLIAISSGQGITAFPRWTGGDTERLGAHLRIHHDTSIVPGRWFEMPDHFRVGLGGATADLEEGLRRIGAALDELA